MLLSIRVAPTTSIRAVYPGILRLGQEHVRRMERDGPDVVAEFGDGLLVPGAQPAGQLLPRGSAWVPTAIEKSVRLRAAIFASIKPPCRSTPLRIGLRSGHIVDVAV